VKSCVNWQVRDHKAENIPTREPHDMHRESRVLPYVFEGNMGLIPARRAVRARYDMGSSADVTITTSPPAKSGFKKLRTPAVL
jgi:hypothetical protein